MDLTMEHITIVTVPDLIVIVMIEDMDIMRTHHPMIGFGLWHI